MHSMNDDEYCLRWHRHLSNLIENFNNLLENESLADVFFFAEGQLVKAHKVVLSSCSTYFQSLFKETIERHPIIVLKDVKLAHLRALLQFMYRGTVNVPQDALEPIMNIAQTLNIKGLSDGVVNIAKVEQPEEEHPMSLINPKISNNYHSKTPTAAENKSIRSFTDLYNNGPTSVNNVLSSALSVPPALSHLSLPQLASLPPNIASSLASTLSNALPQSIASFIPPRDISSRENECPQNKRRRKHRRKSGEVLDSGDSDGRSSGSPGDSTSNLQFPKIPATITPVGLHRQHIPTFPSNSLPQQQPRDLSMHSLHNTNNYERSLQESNEQHERSHSFRGSASIPGLLLHSPLENHKVQEKPENLERRPLQGVKQVKSTSKSESVHEDSNYRRSESPNCDKSSPATSGNRSDGSSGTTKPSPKFGSDPESLVSPAKASLSQSQSRLDETSSDNHYSDEEREDNGIHQENVMESLSGLTPGPSTSSRPQSEEAPSTPSFLGWPYTSEANSTDEALSNLASDTNQDYFRALNLVRAGFSGILPPRMSSELYSRSSVPLGLPLLLKGNEVQSNQKNLLCYPFPDTPKHFTCEKCGRSYASSGNLKRHKKYECGVEPQFSCPICKKKFQHRHSVKIHVFSTHRNEAGESTSDSTQNSTSTLFATPDGVPSVGPGVWHLPPEASTAASQNQEG